MAKDFFFSSRRRHTRSKRDWSSDVCSSDLSAPAKVVAGADALLVVMSFEKEHELCMRTSFRTKFLDYVAFRSEERRVGKECGVQLGGVASDKRCWCNGVKPYTLTSRACGRE